jgi:hypothetical protein
LLQLTASQRLDPLRVRRDQGDYSGIGDHVCGSSTGTAGRKGGPGCTGPRGLG